MQDLKLKHKEFPEKSDPMEFENEARDYKDNRDADQNDHSLPSTEKDSLAESLPTHKGSTSLWEKSQGADVKGESARDGSKTSTWDPDPDPDPDRDRLSDGDRRRRSGSFYSEDYGNGSPSERSLSPYSRSRTVSRSPPRRTRSSRISNSPCCKTGGGVGRRAAPRPQRPGGLAHSRQHRGCVRSKSKESTIPKELDMVTKRLLSARLLKINDLKNALAELQLRTDELQKENRMLRQLQVRQEKALHRFDETESEIAQLLSRHANETHALRERLRRSQDHKRAVERRLKESDERLQRSQATTTRLRKLTEQQELGPREELSRRLDEEKARATEGEHRIKELERSMELSNGSYQRQVVAERKRTLCAQEEIKTLQEELARLSNKLKEKERELDARNIYANRMAKTSSRKDADAETKGKAASSNSSKAVQTEDRTLSMDFPTPPPAITDGNEYNQEAPDDYFLPKELDKVDRKLRGKDVNRDERGQEQQRSRERDRDRERVSEKVKVQEKEEKPKYHPDVSGPDEKAKSLRDGREKEDDGRKKATGHAVHRNEAENKKKHVYVQEEVERWNQETLAMRQQATEAERRRKDQLLAKMREIDRQNQPLPDPMFAEPNPAELPRDDASVRSPTRNAAIFRFTEHEESPGSRAGSGGREGGRRSAGVGEGGVGTAGMGRRGVRPQISGEDLAFGSYAPSIGRPAARGTSGLPPPPPPPTQGSGEFSLGDLEKEKERETGSGGRDRKSSLMEQLFGTLTSPPASSSKMEVLAGPLTPNGTRSRREELVSFASNSTASSSTPPVPVRSTLHVAETRPTVRAIASFDDDIEELTL